MIGGVELFSGGNKIVSSTAVFWLGGEVGGEDGGLGEEELEEDEESTSGGFGLYGRVVGRKVSGSDGAGMLVSKWVVGRVGPLACAL